MYMYILCTCIACVVLCVQVAMMSWWSCWFLMERTLNTETSRDVLHSYLLLVQVTHTHTPQYLGLSPSLPSLTLFFTVSILFFLSPSLIHSLSLSLSLPPSLSPSPSPGHAVTVAILLDHGADIKAHSDRTKDTALSLACSGGRQEVYGLNSHSIERLWTAMITPNWDSLIWVDLNNCWTSFVACPKSCTCIFRRHVHVHVIQGSTDHDVFSRWWRFCYRKELTSNTAMCRTTPPSLSLPPEGMSIPSRCSSEPELTSIQGERDLRLPQHRLHVHVPKP